MVRKRKSSAKANPSPKTPKKNKKNETTPSPRTPKRQQRNDATPNSTPRRSKRLNTNISPEPKVCPNKSAPVPSPSTSRRRKGSKPDSQCPTTPKNVLPSTVEEYGDSIVKSPLDTHGYKMVRLTQNGLKGLLISNCLHPLDINFKKSGCGDQPSKEVFERIREFNQAHANFQTNTGSKDKACKKGTTDSVCFSKATKEQEKATEARRKKINAKRNVGKVKCRRGISNKDDDMESFCNNNFVVVLYVKAGFFQDPPDVPGMAHFCEHVILLKSKNFQEVEPLLKFVESEGGGECNAGTDDEYTALYFYVNEEHIDHSLEILSDIFTNPEFPENFIENEIDSVNSEYEGKRLNDAFRVRGLFQSCILDGHPASNFGMGSKDTLPNKDKSKDGEITTRIKEWMGRYYCTENMMLGLQGPKTLPELEQLFSRYFSKVPKRFGNFPTSTCSIPQEPCTAIPPINWSKWNRLYHMVPTSESNFMTVSWALDPKFGKNFETKPLVYYSYILTRKERGSLDDFLKQRGWITLLTVNSPEMDFFTTKFHTILSIRIELTAEGLNKRIEVLRAVFSYIKLLQINKACPRIFDEVRQLKADLFHYRSDNNLSDPTLGRVYDDCSSGSSGTIVELFQTLAKTGAPSRVLLDTFLLTKYDEGILNEFVECLKPSQAMVLFASPIFEKDANEKEKWYQARYFTKPMCPELIADIEKKPPLGIFSFPKPNTFISTSMCFPDEKSGKEKLEKKSDLLCYESEKGRVQYGNARCQKGLLQTAHYTIDFLSPVFEDLTDMINRPSVDVLWVVLKYALDTDLGMALSSLISSDVEVYQGYLRVTLFGPSAKLPQLAKIVLDTVERIRWHFVMITSDPSIMDAPRLPLLRDLIKIQAGYYKNTMNASEECADILAHYVVDRTAYFHSDYVRVLESMYETVDFRNFLDDFHSRFYVDADLNGCVTKSQAIEFSQHLQRTWFTPYRRKTEYEFCGRAIQLPLGERCLFVKSKNSENRNVVVQNYYQVGVVNQRQRQILSAIYSFLNEKSFEGLRTKLNLGYYGQTELLQIGGIPGVRVSVQGAADVNTSGFIDEGIDTFLLNIYKEGFASQKAFKDNILIWSPEGTEFTLAEGKKFFEAHFLPCGSGFRKLSIQIKGHKKSSGSQPAQPTKLNEKVARYSSGVKLLPSGSTGISTYSRYLELCLKNVQEQNGYFITDVQSFKNSLPCFGTIEHLNEDDT